MLFLSPPHLSEGFELSGVGWGGEVLNARLSTGAGELAASFPVLP